MLFPFFLSAQLTSFTLSVTPTPETCPGNGSLVFTTSGTTTGATLVFTIYKLPDMTNPVATQSATELGGLQDGQYVVIATQTLGSATNQQQQTATITSQIPPFGFTLDAKAEICGSDGSITVLVNPGTFASAEIISGPQTRPLQTDPVFANLTGGNYQVRVYDGCGEADVLPISVPSFIPAFQIGAGTTISQLPDCNTITAVNVLSAQAGQAIAFPISVTYVLTAPDGTQTTYQQNVSSGNLTQFSLAQNFPFYYDQEYSYHIAITDACGNTFKADNSIDEKVEVNAIVQNTSCNERKLIVSASTIVYPIHISFLSAPEGFDPLNHNPSHPGPFDSTVEYINGLAGLPLGEYVIEVTDSCDRSGQATVTIQPTSGPMPVAISGSPGCAEGSGSISIGVMGAALTNVELFSGPVGFEFQAGDNLNQFLSNGSFFLYGLFPGSCSFYIQDSCGREAIVNVPIVPVVFGESQLEVTPQCSAFDLEVSFNVTGIGVQLWLQKKHPETGLWSHPITNFPMLSEIDQESALELENFEVTPMILATGEFRVLATFGSVSSDQEEVQCVHEVGTFTYSGLPEIKGVWAISCGGGQSDVIIDAVGSLPLIYRITQKNGQPFTTGDQSEAVFTGLEPGIYNFQVEDNCGFIRNHPFDINDPVALAIVPVALCDGQPGSLSVPALGFLEYKWWKEEAPEVVLSTDYHMDFSAFNAATDQGTYYVQLIYDNPNSCINQTLSFEISDVLQNPEAGEDRQYSYCGTQGNLDLFSLIGETFDDFGSWIDVDGSGALVGSVVNSDALSPSVYHFTYRIEGLCDFADEATVTLTFNAVPETPSVSVEAQICEGSDLQLTATAIPGVSYLWTGPDGFTSSEQNPLITNVTPAASGVYSLSVTNGNCSAPPVEVSVEVGVLPDFTITSGCVGGKYMLEATGIDDAGWTFEWASLNQSLSADNPIDITGEPAGIYTLTATSPDGCQKTQSIEVPGTICEIPKGISPNGDGENDFFDLSGLDVQRVKIFNRYGMKVYELNDYVNQWDGRDYNGNELPTATYYYLVELRSGEARTGWVYLTRT